jgi:hypothetical protein
LPGLGLPGQGQSGFASVTTGSGCASRLCTQSVIVSSQQNLQRLLFRVVLRVRNRLRDVKYKPAITVCVAFGFRIAGYRCRRKPLALSAISRVNMGSKGQVSRWVRGGQSLASSADKPRRFLSLVAVRTACGFPAPKEFK